MHVCVCLCVSVWLIWWFGGQPKQTGMAFVAWEGGCTASVSYTVVAHTHSHTNTQIPHTNATHINTCTHTVCKLHCPWLFRCPPGFSCPSVVTEWPFCPLQLEQGCAEPHTYRNTIPEALQKPAASLQKSSMNLVCLIDSIPAKQTNTPCCSELSDTFSLQTPMPFFWKWRGNIQRELSVKGSADSKLWYSPVFTFHHCYLQQMDSYANFGSCTVADGTKVP